MVAFLCAWAECRLLTEDLDAAAAHERETYHPMQTLPVVRALAGSTAPFLDGRLEIQTALGRGQCEGLFCDCCGEYLGRMAYDMQTDIGRLSWHWKEACLHPSCWRSR